jgi:GNAT superfamily N-acetyltransferase
MKSGNARNQIRRPGDHEAMPCEAHFTADASEALSACEPYLISRPVEHNVVLTVLRRRITDPTPGRYWWIDDEGTVVGFAMQSPLSFHGAITPMATSATQTLVDVVSETAPDLPGVASDAASAASFAGNWAERLRIPVTPVEAQRVYRLVALHPPEGVPGRFRPAKADRDILVAHRISFHADTGEPGELDAAAAVERSLRRCFVWDDGGVVASAIATIPEAGVVRVGVVYTPLVHRRRGYASALVAATSAWAREHDHSDCILYTQLVNPTSNAIYRAIGYQPVAEVLRYRFG